MAATREFLSAPTGVVALVLTIVGAAFVLTGAVMAIVASVTQVAEARVAVPSPLWGAGVTILGIGAAILLAGLGLGTRRVAAVRERARLQRHGVVTDGTILEVSQDYRVRVNRRHPWRVRYEYRVGGEAYEGSESVWDKPAAYEPGAKVAVVYDAADRRRSALKRG